MKIEHLGFSDLIKISVKRLKNISKDKLLIKATIVGVGRNL